MEVVAERAPDVRRKLLRSGRRLRSEQACERWLSRKVACELEPLDDDVEVARFAEEPALDDRQRGGVARAQPDAARRPRLQVEDAHPGVVARPVVGRARPGEQVDIPGARHAGGARRLDERVRPKDRTGARDVAGGLPVERGCPLPADPRAVMVEQRLADGQPFDDGDRVARELVLRTDPASQEDRRGEVRAGGEDDDAGVDPLARRRDHACGTRSVEREAVDRRLGEDGQVRPRAGGVEVGERSVPAGPLDDVRRERRPADGMCGIVGVVEQRVARVARRLEKRDVQRRGLGRVSGDDAEPLPRAGEIGREGLVSPRLAPFVVVRGRPDDGHARVVGGTAADHARAERTVVLTTRAPVVREAERARVEQFAGPTAGGSGAVVGPRLDHADAAVGVLGEVRRDDAPGGAAPNDRHVESHRRSIRGRRRAAFTV